MECEIIFNPETGSLRGWFSCGLSDADSDLELTIKEYIERLTDKADMSTLQWKRRSGISDPLAPPSFVAWKVRIPEEAPK